MIRISILYCYSNMNIWNDGIWIFNLLNFSIEDARIDIDAPLWDQSTFAGRFKHFAFMTDPRTVLTSENDLNKAKTLVEQYR